MVSMTGNSKRTTGFPPVIYSTSERPDIVIWSASARLVILLELTVPAEEGIVAAPQARYQASG